MYTVTKSIMSPVFETVMRWDPVDFNPLVWIDAQDGQMFPGGTGPVAIALDKSGRGNHNTQASASAQPVLTKNVAGVNGDMPGIVFNGTTDWLDTGISLDMTSGGDFSVFAAVKKRGATPVEYVVSQAHTVTPSYSSDWIHLLQNVGASFAVGWIRAALAGDLTVFGNDEMIISNMIWDMSERTFTTQTNKEAIDTSTVVAEGTFGGVGTIKIGTRGDATTSFFNGILCEYFILRIKADSELTRQAFDYLSKKWGGVTLI